MKTKYVPKILKFNRYTPQRTVSFRNMVLIKKLPHYSIPASGECESCTDARNFLRGNGIQTPAVIAVEGKRSASKFYWGSDGLHDYRALREKASNFPEVVKYTDSIWSAIADVKEEGNNESE